LRNGAGTVTDSDPAFYGWRTNADGSVLGDGGIVYGLGGAGSAYPTYYCAKLMPYFAKDGDTVVSATGSYPLLATYAVKRTNGTLTLLVINKSCVSNITASINLTGYQPVSNATVYSYGIPQDDAARTGVGSPDIAQSSFDSAQSTFTATFAPFSATVMVLSPANQPPLTPANLTATASNAAVGLTWSLSGGADSYIIKRSTTSGSGYTPIASGVTATSYLDTGLVNGTTYYYVVAATNNYGGSPNSAEASAKPTDTKALYAFEGNAQDSSGSGNHGTATAVSYVAGKVGAQAAQFNGTSSYVLIPRSITDDFTVAMWVKTTDTAGSAGAQWWSGNGLVDGEVGGGGADWGTAIVNGKFVLGVGSSSGDTTIASSVNINDGTWHHVAATRNNTSGAMAVYVDGVSRGSGTGPTGSRTFPPSLRIGSLQTANNFLSGTLDDVRLYDRILTVGEIAALIGTPPAAPTGLAATAGDGSVALSWSASVTATNYFVKRSTTSGSGYTSIATNANLAFTNTGLANGTAYFYVVSAVNTFGESTNSAQVCARPTSSAPVAIGVTNAPGQLQISWPADHTGWQLQSQTNSLTSGLGTNWVNVSSSVQTNQVAVPLNTTNGAVFFRLVRPY
jgi:fibronectin type 3 domain-containing protein